MNKPPESQEDIWKLPKHLTRMRDSISSDLENHPKIRQKWDKYRTQQEIYQKVVQSILEAHHLLVKTESPHETAKGLCRCFSEQYPFRSSCLLIESTPFFPEIFVCSESFPIQFSDMGLLSSDNLKELLLETFPEQQSSFQVVSLEEKEADEEKPGQQFTQVIVLELSIRDGIRGRFFIQMQDPLAEEDTFRPHFSGLAKSICRAYQCMVSESESRLLTRAAEEASAGLIIIDMQGKLLYGNKSLLRLWGYETLAEVTGSGPEGFIQDTASFYRILEEVKDTGKWQGEVTAIRRDQTCFPTLFSAILYETDHGAQPVIMGSFIDITQMKSVEEALRLSEEKYRKIVLCSPFGMHHYELTNENRLLFCGFNPMAEKLLQTDHSAFIGKPMEEVFPSLSDSDLLEKYRHIALTGGVSDRIEQQFELEQNPVVFEIYAFQSLPRRVVVMFTDISERLSMKAGLEESEALLKTILDAAPIGIGLMENRILGFSNRTFHKLIGYENEELINQSARILYPNEKEYHRVEEIKYPLLREHGYASVETVMKRKDGSLFPVLLSSATIVQKDVNAGLVYTVLDLSALKRAEATYRNMFLESQVGLVRTTLEDGVVLDGNDRIARMIGFKNREALLAANVRVSEFYPDKKIRRLMIQEAQEFGKVTNKEMLMNNIRGEKIWIRYSAIINWEKKWLDGVVEDITEIKRAERLLLESERKYRQIVENSIEGIFILQAGRLRFCNHRFADMFGYSDPGEMQKVHLSSLVAEESYSLIINQLRKINTGIPQKSAFIFIAKKRDSTLFEAETMGQLIEYGGKSAIQGVLRDVSEKKRLEEQLMHALKLESIGRLAGGIAHDFNNLLTAISGNAEMALMSLNRSDPIYTDIDDILKVTDRATKLTRQLLTFSRKQRIKPVMLNLNTTLDNMLGMLKRIIGEDVELRMELSPGLHPIKADPGQIDQVIVNLVVNSRDAVEEGGILEIRTENRNVEGCIFLGRSEEVSGKFSVMHIIDNGCGIPQKIRKDIFEPFFTTKSKEKGTGLGLSQVFGIVTQNKGHILMESEEGRGTHFSIYFPAVDHADPLNEDQKTKLTDLRGEGRILVVEDDRTVRSLSVRTLQKFGYTAMKARSGAEALSLCREMEKPFDMVVTDLVMPHMGGEELIQSINQFWNDIPVLYMSGYPLRNMSESDLYDKGGNFIQKPFRPHQLAEAVGMILGRKKNEEE